MAKSADAFRTISEVAEWLELPTHVLRFWESKFTQVKPVKRAGGRRYYRPNDMLLLGGIKTLLHDDGMTIKGAQKVLRDQGVKHVASLSQPIDAADAPLKEAANEDILEGATAEADVTNEASPLEGSESAPEAPELDTPDEDTPQPPEDALEASETLEKSEPDEAKTEPHEEQAPSDSLQSSAPDASESDTGSESSEAESAGHENTEHEPTIRTGGLPSFLRSADEEDAPPPAAISLKADVPKDIADDEADVDAGLLSRVATLKTAVDSPTREKLLAARNALQNHTAS